LSGVWHCGHLISWLCAICPGGGASLSAIHSRRQDSWAVREQGHGLRQTLFSGSSVSSPMHTQHLRISGAGVCGCGVGEVADSA
jgi:hypothetical protein